MRKEEFLEKLRARLSQTMSQQEVTAQIRYYENYIQEQIQNGGRTGDAGRVQPSGDQCL